MSKVTITPVNKKYTGICHGGDPKIVIGKQTTVSGILWWKEVEEVEVWLAIDSGVVHSWNGLDSDYYYKVVNVFHKDNKDHAEAWLVDYIGE